MKLKLLIKALDKCKFLGDCLDLEVKGITRNSKNVGDGFVFVAVKGVNADGHDFIEEAIKRGAKAIIVQCQVPGVRYQDKALFIEVKDTREALAQLAARFYGNPTKKIKVIGVTGTNGKTTVTYLLEALLKKAGKESGVIGTIDYHYRDKVFSSGNTTPGAVELQSMFADMVREGIPYAVMEVSSHALDQERTAGINFYAALFTNLTQDHLDYHRTMGKYFKAKAKLFEQLNPKALGIINLDDPYGRKLARTNASKTITYSLVNPADIMARDIKFDIAHTEFTLQSAKENIPIKTRLIGRHNVYNILAAVSFALREGLGKQAIQSAIAGFKSAPGRLEMIETGMNFSLFVDYAHTEDALRNVIITLRQVSKGRVIVVFGCGGERDKTKRPKMGKAVSELADYAFITSDNPRSEDPQKIILDITAGITKSNYTVIPDRAEAIKRSLSFAQKGDIVLLAGKGHENYQVLKDGVIHFDDREAARACLKSMN